MIQFFITCLLVTFVGAEGTVKVNVDRLKIKEGDSVNLTVTATNINDDPDVNLPIMEDFKVVSGPNQSSSTNIQFVNGKMTKNSTVTLTWTLIPVKTGQVIIPVIKIRGGGDNHFHHRLLQLQYPREESLNQVKSRSFLLRLLWTIANHIEGSRSLSLIFYIPKLM